METPSEGANTAALAARGLRYYLGVVWLLLGYVTLRYAHQRTRRRPRSRREPHNHFKDGGEAARVLTTDAKPKPHHSRARHGWRGVRQRASARLHHLATHWRPLAMGSVVLAAAAAAVCSLGGAGGGGGGLTEAAATAVAGLVTSAAILATATCGVLLSQHARVQAGGKGGQTLLQHHYHACPRGPRAPPRAAKYISPLIADLLAPRARTAGDMAEARNRRKQQRELMTTTGTDKRKKKKKKKKKSPTNAGGVTRVSAHVSAQVSGTWHASGNFLKSVLQVRRFHSRSRKHVVPNLGRKPVGPVRNSLDRFRARAAERPLRVTDSGAEYGSWGVPDHELRAKDSASSASAQTPGAQGTGMSKLSESGPTFPAYGGAERSETDNTRSTREELRLAFASSRNATRLESTMVDPKTANRVRGDAIGLAAEGVFQGAVHDDTFKKWRRRLKPVEILQNTFVD